MINVLSQRITEKVPSYPKGQRELLIAGEDDLFNLHCQSINILI